MWLSYFSRYSIIPAKCHRYQSTNNDLKVESAGGEHRAQHWVTCLNVSLSSCCLFHHCLLLPQLKKMDWILHRPYLVIYQEQYYYVPRGPSGRRFQHGTKSTSVLGQCRLTQDKVCCWRGVPRRRLFFTPASRHHFVQLSWVSELR